MNLLSTAIRCFLAAVCFSTFLKPGASSIVDVTEDDVTGEVTVSVLSSQPETTFYGRVGSTDNNFSIYERLRQQFAAGEEFCVFTPVLGMRNLTVFAYAVKFWDSDTELELRNSEGVTLDSQKFVLEGRRNPWARIPDLEIPTPDIYQLCIRNTGSAKTIAFGLHQTQRKKIEAFITLLKNTTASYNISVGALYRLESQIATVQSLAKMEMDEVVQDYFRLLNIDSWIKYRGIAGSLGMLFCSFMSTMVIRRWFGSPRSSV